MGDAVLNSLSVTNISAAHISLSSLNAFYLLAQAISVPIDGSYLVPQSLPWSKMALNGDLILNSGNWRLGGKLAVSSFSTITRITTSSIVGDETIITKATFGNVTTNTISSIYISTAYMDINNLSFSNAQGLQLSVGTMAIGTGTFSSLTIANFFASTIALSSFTGNVGTLRDLNVSSVFFYDPVYLTTAEFRLAGGNFYLNNINLFSNLAYSSQLISTTGGLQDLNTNTSNTLQGYITTLSNTVNTNTSNLSTNTGSTFSTLQKALSTGLSTLSTSVGLALSSLSTTTGWNFSTSRNLISTLQFAASSISSGNLATGNLSATVARINTMYVSTMSSKFGYFDVLSAATLYADVVSTSITQDIVQLTVDQLNVSTAYMSTFYNISSFTREFHASTAHALTLIGDLLQVPIISTLSANTGANFLSLSGTISSGFISTTRGLGTAGYISSQSLTSTTQGLGTLGYISEGVVRANLTSTVAGLGSAGYVSSLTLTSSLTSTTQGLGQLSYVSSPSLTSSLRGLGTLGYLSVAVNCNDVTSTIRGLGQLGYLSTIPPNLSTRALTTSSIQGSTIKVQDIFAFSSLSTFGFRAYGNTSSHVDYLLKVSSLTVSNRIEANEIRGFTNGLDFLFLAGTAVQSGTTIRYSPNGQEWFNASGSFTSEAYSFAIGPDKAIAAGSNLVGSLYLKYSTDGISWNTVTDSNVNEPVNYVFYADNRFFASAANYQMGYSDDGLTWNVTGDGFSVKGNGFAYAPDLDILVAGGETAVGSNMKWSDDRGASWQDQTGGDALTNPVNQVAYSNGKFLAASGTSLFESSDGKSWSSFGGGAALFTTIYGVVYGGGKWIAFGQGSPSIQYSFDGTTWYSDATGSFTTTTVSVTYGNGRWVALGNSGGSYSVKYSFDGVTWSNASINVPTSIGYGVNACQFPSTETPVYFYTISSQVANISSLQIATAGITNLDVNNLQVFDTLSTEALFYSSATGNVITTSTVYITSTIMLQDLGLPGNYGNFYLEFGDLYVNGSPVGGGGGGGGITTGQLTSTTVGLGTLGYLSTGGAGGGVTPSDLNSTTKGLAQIGYVSTLTLNSTFISTNRGLGTLGYISSSGLVSTVRGLGSASYVSSLSLKSTVEGLGSASYISSLSLISTVEGLGSASYISSLSLTSTVEGLGSASYISSLSLQSTVEGLGSADYISSLTLNSSLISTVQGLGTLGYLSTGGGGGDVTTADLTSSLQGLGTLGYLSTGGGGPLGPEVYTSSIFVSTLTVDFIHGKLTAGSNSNVGLGDVLAFGLPAAVSLRTIKGSADGQAWTDTNAAFTMEAVGGVYSDSLYWAIGQNNVGKVKVLKSADQITWSYSANEETIALTPQKIYSFSNKTWICGVADDAGEECLWYRINGQNTWTSMQVGNPANVYALAVSSQFMVAGGSNLSGAGYNFLYSEDGGASWSVQTGGQPVDQITDIVYVSSLNSFYACGIDATATTAYYFTSADGKNWGTPATTTNSLAPFRMKYHTNKFWVCGVQQDAGATIRTTNDFITFNPAGTNTFDYACFDIVFDSTKYIAAGSNVGAGKPLKISADTGATWVDANAGDYGNAYIGLMLPPPAPASYVELPVYFSTISAASIYASTFVAKNATATELGVRDITVLSTVTLVDQLDFFHTPQLYWAGNKLYVSSPTSPVVLRQDLLSICTALNSWATNLVPPLTPPF